MADLNRKLMHRCCCQECTSRRNAKFVEYHHSINLVMVEFDERSRRLFAGLLAKQIGRGGIQRVAEITGVSRVTIRSGVRECERSQPSEFNRVRAPGGGRKLIEKKVPK